MSFLANNSTSAPLLANTSFIGTPIKVNQMFKSVHVSLNAHNLKGTLKIHQSTDGITYNVSNQAVYATGGKHYSYYRITGTYLYVEFANGKGDQSAFQLNSYLSVSYRTELEFDLNALTETISVPCLESALLFDENGSTYNTSVLYALGGTGSAGPVQPLHMNGDRLLVDSVNSGNVGVTGFVGITGPVSITGNVGIIGYVGISGPVNITGNVGVTGFVGITGPVSITGNVGVTGFVGITGPVSITGNVGVTGYVGISGPVTFTNTTIGVTGVNLPLDTTHFNVPGSETSLKCMDGYQASLIGGAVYNFSTSDGKVLVGSNGIKPCSVVGTNVNSGAGTYQMSLCTFDDTAINRYDVGGVLIAGYTGGVKQPMTYTGNTAGTKFQLDVRDHDAITAINSFSAKGDTGGVLIAGYNSGTKKGISYISNGASTCLNVDVASLTNSSKSRGDVKTGLNVYTISVPKKTYILSGYTLTANGIFGFNGASMTHLNGLEFAYYNITAYAFCTVAKTLFYDYVDNNWNLQTNAVGLSIPANTWTALTSNYTTSLKGVNSFYTAERNNENLTITYTSGATAYAIGGLTTTNYFNGMIFVPQNYIGRLTQLYFFGNTSSVMHIVKCSSMGLMKKVIYSGSGFSNSNLINIEGVGEPIYPGECVYVYREATATDSFVYGTVILEPY